MNVFTESVTFTYLNFLPPKITGFNRKMFKLLSNPASPKTLAGLDLHSISHSCVCNVHRKGKQLSLTFHEAEPLPLQMELVPSKAK